MKKITQKGIITKMIEGWQLGQSTNIQGSRFWLQKKLCCGGDSINADGRFVIALLRKGYIIKKPRLENDSYWLTRYGLTTLGRSVY